MEVTLNKLLKAAWSRYPTTATTCDSNNALLPLLAGFITSLLSLFNLSSISIPSCPTCRIYHNSHLDDLFPDHAGRHARKTNDRPRRKEEEA